MTTTLTDHHSLFINGGWAPPQGNETLPIVNPTTGDEICAVTLCSAEDVDSAVNAAHAAFPEWSQRAPEERAPLLDAIADEIASREEEIAEILTRDVGVPTEFAKAVQVGWTVQYFRDAAEAARTLRVEEPYGPTATVLRVPVGVVAAITPWNFPLMQSAAKIAPALAAGCTVVLKPSEVAPLSVMVLGDIAEAVDLPAGVLNIVVGTGPEAGEALVQHPKVSATSFTGSTRAGARVAALGAESIKRVTLELGGKSAGVVLPGADLRSAVETTVKDCYANSGQKCVAITRLLISRNDLTDAEVIAVETAQSMRVGDPADPGIDIGPLVSEAQLHRVRGHISKAIDSGAKLLTGGLDAPSDTPAGYFVQPTVFSRVTPDMPIAREEVFGPVLAILSYESVDEAIAIANDSPYGLGGSVWAPTKEEGFEVAKKIRTGQVAINGAIPTADLPFGGFKQSGIGREGGRYALEEYLELQTIY